MDPLFTNPVPMIEFFLFEWSLTSPLSTAAEEKKEEKKEESEESEDDMGFGLFD